MDATYVSARSFTVVGNQTNILVVNRRLKCNCAGDGYKYGLILSSAYSSPNTTVTLTPTSDDITGNLTVVEWSVALPTAVPGHLHEGETSGGFLDNRHLLMGAIQAGFATQNVTHAKTVLDNLTKITRLANWEQMSVSTVQGAAAIIQAYTGVLSDSRYIYFVPRDSDTFLQFDAKGLFKDTNNWKAMNMSTAQGGGELNDAYTGAAYDGRYIYYCPRDSSTIVRFDTQGSFINSGDWSQMNLSTALGASLPPGKKYCRGATFDGRYIYFVPRGIETFIRYDTHGVFTTVGSWSRMSMSTAQGGAFVSKAYKGATFDGRYIYYCPHASATFLRFDTQGTFTTESDWQKMSMSTALGAAAVADAFTGESFDEHYVYFVPYDSNTFLRFHIHGSFTNPDDWERMSMSTAQGAAELDSAYYDATHDGRYIYFGPRDADTFLKYDIEGSFSDPASWSQMSMSTVTGAMTQSGYNGVTCDGRFVYFCAYSAATFVRFKGMETKRRHPRFGCL